MKKVGTALIALGILIPTSIYVYYYFFVNWSPISVPVHISQGETIHETFKVNYTARYFATLNFSSNRNIAIETLQCLTGLSGFSPEPDCSKTSRLLHFRWELKRTNGSTISQGTYGDAPGSGGLSYNEADVSFVYFDAKRGDSFDLVVTFDQDSSTLNIANPLLCVSANSVNLEWAMLLEFLSPIVGAAMAAVGLVLFVLGRRSRTSYSVPAP